jgi:hypothetical protein
LNALHHLWVQRSVQHSESRIREATTGPESINQTSSMRDLDFCPDNSRTQLPVQGDRLWDDAVECKRIESAWLTISRGSLFEALSINGNTVQVFHNPLHPCGLAGISTPDVIMIRSCPSSLVNADHCTTYTQIYAFLGHNYRPETFQLLGPPPDKELPFDDTQHFQHEHLTSYMNSSTDRLRGKVRVIDVCPRLHGL